MYESRCKNVDDEGYEYLFGDSECEGDVLMTDVNDEICRTSLAIPTLQIFPSQS